MRSRSNGGVIGAYALPTQNYANGVFFIHDAAIYNTGPNPIWPLGTGFIYSASGGTVTTAAFNSNYKTHTFTSNGTFTVTTGTGILDILMVGGGGAGGSVYTTNASYDNSAGGGGGGGGVGVIRTWVNPGTTFTVEVGTGGTSADVGSGVQGTGNPTKITSTMGHNYFVYGGGGGGRSYTAVSPFQWSPTSGGSPGGTPCTQGIGTVAGASVLAGSFSGPTTNDTATGYGNGTGSSPSTLGYYIGSGGGGAATAGYGGNETTYLSKAGWGGDGYYWPITQCYYGGGGGAGRVYTTTLPAATQTNASGGNIGISLAGTHNYGLGGYINTVNGGYAGGYAGADGFGGGGGGSSLNTYVATTLRTPGGFGGTGTVIFCYRYQ